LLSPSSYTFVNDLLIKYKDDERIGHINLSNFNPNYTKDYNNSYFFSSHVKVWGFATWRRMWETYNISMPEWSYVDQNKLLNKFCSNSNEKRGIKKMFDLHCNNDDPWTWDYQWLFNCWNRDTLSITPSKNLCLDIGFEREDSSHNKGENPFTNPIELMNFPLMHPSELKRNINFDKELSNIICPSRLSNFNKRISRFFTILKKAL